MSERSKKLARQFKKVLGNEDAESILRQLAVHLTHTGGDAEAAAIEALGNFSAFCDSIEESYRQYEEQNKMAVRNLQISSAELTESNRAMERLNRSMNAMLDSLGEGFLFFNSQGICSPVFSKATLEMLETSPADKHIRDVLRLTGKERETIDSWIAMVFNNDLALSFSDLAAIAPSSYRHSKGMVVQLQFKPMYRTDKSLASVLVIATDRTQEEKAKKELKAREARALRTIRIARNRNNFLRFIAQCNELFAFLEGNAVPSSLTLEQFKRDLHTLKGVAATFQLHDIAYTINSVESNIANLLDHGNATLEKAFEAARKFLPDMRKHFSAAKILAAEVLGNNFEEMGNIRTIETTRLTAFSQQLKQTLSGTPQADALERYFLEHVMAVPVHSALHFMDTLLQETAERLGKRVKHCLFEGANFMILTEPYENLLASLVHIVRNVADHGIEEPALREQLEKSPEGQVTVTTEKFIRDGQEWMRLCLEDDGGGIDVENLRKMLSHTRGAASTAGKSDDDIMQTIFEDDVTVRDTVTEFSGRGIGLSAVRAEVARLGGSIRVESKPILGTTFFLEVPLIWEIKPFAVNR